MLAYTYIEQGKFELLEKQRPQIKDSRDAIVRVTLSSICTSDLHIKHGSVPRALPGITVGHEMVGIVAEIGIDVGFLGFPHFGDFPGGYRPYYRCRSYRSLYLTLYSAKTSQTYYRL